MPDAMMYLYRLIVSSVTWSWSGDRDLNFLKITTDNRDYNSRQQNQQQILDYDDILTTSGIRTNQDGYHLRFEMYTNNTRHKEYNFLQPTTNQIQQQQQQQNIEHNQETSLKLEHSTETTTTIAVDSSRAYYKKS